MRAIELHPCLSEGTFIVVQPLCGLGIVRKAEEDYDTEQDRGCALQQKDWKMLAFEPRRKPPAGRLTPAPSLKIAGVIHMRNTIGESSTKRTRQGSGRVDEC